MNLYLNLWLTINFVQDIVSQQNVWLTDELTVKTDELSKLRQKSTEISCKLKSELAERTEEAAFLNVILNLVTLRNKGFCIFLMCHIL